MNPVGAPPRGAMAHAGRAAETDRAAGQRSYKILACGRWQETAAITRCTASGAGLCPASSGRPLATVAGRRPAPPSSAKFVLFQLPNQSAPEAAALTRSPATQLCTLHFTAPHLHACRHIPNNPTNITRDCYYFLRTPLVLLKNGGFFI